MDKLCRELTLEEKVTQTRPPAAVIVPFFDIDGKRHVLFEIRSDKISHPGQISFPGGRYDPVKDRDLLDTALRETEEETGIRREDVKVMCPGGIAFNPFGTVVFSFIGHLEPASLEKVRPSEEVKRLFWLPVEDLRPGSFKRDSSEIIIGTRRDESGGMRPGVTAGKRRQGIFYSDYITTPMGDIWGITGTLLKKALLSISPGPNLP